MLHRGSISIHPTHRSLHLLLPNVLASSNLLETKSNNFKNLFPISREKEGRLYRYFFGETNSYVKAKKFKAKAIRKGYEYAFIVAFRENKKIKLSTVIPK
jgi:N-acetylmuramoyl-L-alanine amidase